VPFSETTQTPPQPEKSSFFLQFHTSFFKDSRPGPVPVFLWARYSRSNVSCFLFRFSLPLPPLVLAWAGVFFPVPGCFKGGLGFILPGEQWFLPRISGQPGLSFFIFAKQRGQFFMAPMLRIAFPGFPPLVFFFMATGHNFSTASSLSSSLSKPILFLFSL